MLPTDAKARKDVPLYSGLIRYFHDALIAVAELSRIGNEQHNPGKPLHWDRSKSGDELDALARHLFEAGTIDVDKVRHSVKVAWRALANAQKEIELASRYESYSPAATPNVKLDWREPSAPVRGVWIEWRGGECPVPDDTVVEYRLRAGYSETGREACILWWGRDMKPHGYDIIAYRVPERRRGAGRRSVMDRR